MAQTMSIEEVKGLSNDELANVLREYGVDVGPIMVTTRSVYERKLQRLIENVDYQHVADTDDNNELTYEQYAQEEGYTIPPPAQIPQPSPSPPKPAPRSPSPIKSEGARQRFTDPNAPSPRQPIVRDPNVRYVPKARTTIPPPTAASPAPVPKQSTGLPFMVKFFIFLVIAVIFYLIYANMDTAAETPDSLKADMPV